MVECLFDYMPTHGGYTVCERMNSNAYVCLPCFIYLYLFMYISKNILFVKVLLRM